MQTFEATLIVMIDEAGDVKSVTVEGALQPTYKALLQHAASRWKFHPATRNGTPVKFRKMIAIRLTPPA
jgi:hypothetical protein